MATRLTAPMLAHPLARRASTSALTASQSGRLERGQVGLGRGSRGATSSSRARGGVRLFLLLQVQRASGPPARRPRARASPSSRSDGDFRLELAGDTSSESEADLWRPSSAQAGTSCALSSSCAASDSWRSAAWEASSWHRSPDSTLRRAADADLLHLLLGHGEGLGDRARRSSAGGTLGLEGGDLAGPQPRSRAGAAVRRSPICSAAPSPSRLGPWSRTWTFWRRSASSRRACASDSAPGHVALARARPSADWPRSSSMPRALRGGRGLRLQARPTFALSQRACASRRGCVEGGKLLAPCASPRPGRRPRPRRGAHRASSASAAKRGDRLGRGHDRGPALLEGLLRGRDPRVQRASLCARSSSVLALLVLGERPGRFPQVDFALDDAVRLLLRVGHGRPATRPRRSTISPFRVATARNENLPGWARQKSRKAAQARRRCSRIPRMRACRMARRRSPRSSAAVAGDQARGEARRRGARRHAQLRRP